LSSFCPQKKAEKAVTMKKAVVKLFRKLGLAGKIVILRNGALKDWDWFRTFDTGKSEDKNGQPLAWLTYAFLYFIEPRLNKSLTVFEYGCGNSTFWYAARVKQVFSVEHHPEWYNYILKKKPANSEIALAEEKQAYLNSISFFEQKYDFIVVDGIHRNECMDLVPDFLTPHGVVILDNSERPEYAPAIEGIIAKGFRKIDFYGMAPVTPLAGTTTVFYRDGNCLGI